MNPRAVLVGLNNEPMVKGLREEAVVVVRSAEF
jgi:hypothetical protein